jgi:hypothetical protein
MTDYLYPCKSDLEQVPSITRLVDYYNEHIEKIAEILGTPKSDIPVGITLHLVINKNDTHLGSGYLKPLKKIKYEYREEKTISEDIGRLIHEGAHVVQDYPEGIDHKHPCWCWMEGIADYCRNEIDKEFDIRKNLVGDPRQGYREAAHFISWLKRKEPCIIQILNKHIHDNAHLIKKFDDIFMVNLGCNYMDLFREYKAQYVSNLL